MMKNVKSGSLRRESVVAQGEGCHHLINGKDVNSDPVVPVCMSTLKRQQCVFSNLLPSVSSCKGCPHISPVRTSISA